MISLLDANILIDAEKVGLVPRLLAAVGQRPWLVTQEVFDELTSLGAARQRALSAVVRASPALGTPEAGLSALLIRGGSWAKLGVGEASCIAAAHHDPRLEFVTWDKGASWRALHELRGRTVVGHTWLDRLVQGGDLSKGEADAMVRADPHRHHPAWW